MTVVDERMSETVKVSVDTQEEEAYPVLMIREGDRANLEIPRPLFDALRRAEQMVEDAEAAIMEYLGETYPENLEIADWLRARADDVALMQVMAAWKAEHPDGPEWQHMPVAERDRLLREAGWGGRRG